MPFPPIHRTGELIPLRLRDKVSILAIKALNKIKRPNLTPQVPNAKKYVPDWNNTRVDFHTVMVGWNLNLKRHALRGTATRMLNRMTHSPQRWPVSRPNFGLTLTATGIKVCPTHLIVTLICGSEIAIHLTDCFAKRYQPDSYDERGVFEFEVPQFEETDEDESQSLDRWTLDEQRIIEAAIAEAVQREGVFYVTLSMPRNAKHWWESLNRKCSGFFAYIWIDSTTTLQSLLVESGHRTLAPPYPTKNQANETRHPVIRPLAGLTAPCRVVCVEHSIDSWWIQFDAAFEFTARLIDCYHGLYDNARHAAAAKGDALRIVDRYDRQTVGTIPEVQFGMNSWWQDLRARSEQAAYLWLTQNVTLNQVLVDRGIASAYPF